MKVNTRNEYSQLKSVILGRPEGANWPTGDLFFDRMQLLSTYKGKLRRGPIEEQLISDVRDELLFMKDRLEDLGVNVYRPEIQDYSRTKMHYEHLPTGMHSYSARDILLSIGDMMIECPTPFVSRYQEFEAYDVIKQEAIKDGCRWIAAPRPRMETAECVIKGVPAKIQLTERYPIFDAANICKFGDKLLYLISNTANMSGAKWLQNVVGTDYEVIVWDNINTHAHIDSTLISLKKDMILINASKVQGEQLPKFLKSYRKIWVSDCVETKFHKFPYASKWIGMNILSINQDTVMLDPKQTDLCQQLKNEKFEIIEVPLSHSRTLGGGHHSITCDLEREDA